MDGWQQALGGLALFLLGMVVLTDGLRAAAGARFNRALARFTRSPASGAATGALATALVGSSSATTVATVGLVNAGLLPFDRALGVVFGANVGTTLKGWLVVLLGFKLALGALLHPVLLAGALAVLLLRGRARSVGWAVVGFTLAFLGIEELREGMAPLADLLHVQALPGDGLRSRLLLVALGAGLTLVTQSSSAGIAAALAALHVGSIEWSQAAALAIGMDVGTTSTALVASFGGSPAGRRTGASHTVYNLITASFAFALLEPFAHALEALLPGATSRQPELSLVAFHTTFNLFGVLALLPLTGAFARLMQRLVPERAGSPLARLDARLLVDAVAATGSLWTAVRDLSAEVLAAGADVLATGRGDLDLLATYEGEVVEARRFASAIRPAAAPSPTASRLLSAMHVLDHLDRLLDRWRQPERAADARGDGRLRSAADALARDLRAVTAALREGSPPPLSALRTCHEALLAQRESYRTATLERAVRHELPLELATARLDAARWLERVTEHAWRIGEHLADPEAAPPAPPDVAVAAPAAPAPAPPAVLSRPS